MPEDPFGLTDDGVVIDRARSAAQVAAYDQAVIELAAQTLGQRPDSAEAGAELEVVLEQNPGYTAARDLAEELKRIAA